MLARAAADAAAAEGTAFRRSRSDLVDHGEVEGWPDSDLGLDPNDAEGLAWRDRNRAGAELEAASVRAWTDAAAAWARDAGGHDGGGDGLRAVVGEGARPRGLG